MRQWYAGVIALLKKAMAKQHVLFGHSKLRTFWAFNDYMVMKTHQIPKIIALLESPDENNISVGVRLMESLQLEQEVLARLPGKNLFPTHIPSEATSKVTLYFENQQISLQSRKAYLTFYDQINNLMRTFSNDIALSQRIFNLINTGFFIFAGQLTPGEASMLQILAHQTHHYVLFGLKTSWPAAMDFHKHIQALDAEHSPQMNQSTFIRWRDLAGFCQAPLYYQFSPQPDTFIYFDLLLKVRR